jgi:hypothetical protein
MYISTAIHIAIIAMIFSLAGCSIAIMIGVTRKIIGMLCIPKTKKEVQKPTIEVKNTAKKKTTEKKPVEKKEA